MRPVSDAWKTNQNEIASAPSYFDGNITVRVPRSIPEQGYATVSKTHGGGTSFLGQTFSLAHDYTVSACECVLDIIGSSTPYVLTLSVYPYDVIYDTLETKLFDCTYEGFADLSHQTVAFVPGTNVLLSPGTYAIVLLAPPQGTMKAYGVDTDRYEEGCFISGAVVGDGAQATEDTGFDLAFNVVGVGSGFGDTTWRATNDMSLNNLVDATVTSVFDPTNTTLPLESCHIRILNNRYRWIE